MEVLEQKAFLKKITRRHSPAVIIKGISSTSLTIFIFFKNLLRCKWTAVISFLMLYFSCFCFYLCFYLFIYLFIYSHDIDGFSLVALLYLKFERGTTTTYESVLV